MPTANAKCASATRAAPDVYCPSARSRAARICAITACACCTSTIFGLSGTNTTSASAAIDHEVGGIGEQLVICLLMSGAAAPGSRTETPTS